MLTMLSSCARQALCCQFRCHIQQCYKQFAAPRRGLLSAAFACDNAWQARLSAQELTGLGVSGLDIGNGLMRSLDKRQPVAAVDVDIFVNKLDSFDPTYLPFFVSVLAKFRSTQDCLAKLESTDHALVRCMLSMGQTELLVQWLRDKFMYGIFLDQFSASLLIDHLLEAGDTRLAALVSFDHALQESPSDGWLCNGLMLFACAARSAEQLPTWSATSAAVPQEAAGGDAEEEEEEEDADTKHLIVDYIRRPNYDGQFDLDEERLQLGYTLTCLSRRILAEWPHPQQHHHQQHLGLACALVGHAAMEQPDRVIAALTAAGKSPRQGGGGGGLVSRSAVETADALLASARLLGEGEAEADQRGRRQRCRPAEVEAARAALKDLPVLPDGQPWHAELSAFARLLITEHEAAAGRQLSDLYSQFVSTRLAELRRHSDWLRRRRLFQSVKTQLDGLVEEQEALTAFDNASEISYAAWLAPRTRAEQRVTSKQIWDRDIANANRMLDEASEAATRGGGDFGAKSAAAAMLRRSSGRKEKFKPLKE